MKKLIKNHLCYFTVLFIIISLLFVRCQTSSKADDKSEWERVKTENTIQAYDDYLSKFPEGEFATNAKTEIVNMLVNEAKSGNPIESYDIYIQRFPEGKNKNIFESLVYEYIIKQDSIEYFEEYVKRFPTGKYLAEFETGIFNTIKSGNSSLNYIDFVKRFSESRYINTIDSLLYDSAMKHKTALLFNEYLNAFPNGIYKVKVDSVFEQLLYNEAVLKNTKASFDEYLTRYPKTTHEKLIQIESIPSKQIVKILDRNDSIWKTITTPVTLNAIEGTKIKTLIENPEYMVDILTYRVSDKNKQKISRTLRVPSKTIVSEYFTSSASTWAFNENKNKSEIDNNTLTCYVKSIQFQKLKKINIDFNKNYEIEIKFRITQTIKTNIRSYFGIVWGEETKVRYYFISSQGRYNYGSQTQAVGYENPYGYSGWDGYNPESDIWIKAGNYKKNNFNTLKIIKTGSKLKYYLNNKYVHFENDMIRYRNSWAGYGMGNANANIDYIKIKQYTD